MTSSRPSLPTRARPAALLAALLLTLAAPLLPAGPATGAAAQDVEAVLQERELDYRSARSAFEGALSARAAQEARFSRTLAEIEAAREEGDEDRQAAAYARAQSQAVELEVLRRRVDETAARVAETGRALLAALDTRLETLVEELEAAQTRREREELVAVARTLNDRVREVEAELEPEGSRDLVLAAVPEIALDPRDGPVELRWKIDLLEKRIEESGVRLEEVAARIQELERRRRRNRSLEDLEASVRRFDDDRVPVSSGGTAEGGGGEQAPAPTLEERIESLRVLRAEIEDRRRRFRERLAVFRERLERIGP